MRYNVPARFHNLSRPSRRSEVSALIFGHWHRHLFAVEPLMDGSYLTSWGYAPTVGGLRSSAGVDLGLVVVSFYHNSAHNLDDASPFSGGPAIDVNAVRLTMRLGARFWNMCEHCSQHRIMR